MASLDLKPSRIEPRIIIHGGAGNIHRENLSLESYQTYRRALLDILQDAQHELHRPHASALDVATYAVSLLENCPLFNSGHGAVYTTAGTHELEASVMVSRGYRKRGVGVMKVTRVKNPIKLAREMLIRGEESDGGGALQHNQLHGDICDQLAQQWNLERVDPSYFWTRKRWDEHRRALGLEHDDKTYEDHKRRADDGAGSPSDEPFRNGSAENAGLTVGDPTWDGREYLPQGTVGAVVLDSSGTLCVATSTGGLTNKLPGRIGDTPTLGAGFWAEEYDAVSTKAVDAGLGHTPLAYLTGVVRDCLPGLSQYGTWLPSLSMGSAQSGLTHSVRGVAMSGTGNGDSFLRVNAVRTAAAIARFSSGMGKGLRCSVDPPSLQSAVTTVAGPEGFLQESASDRWLQTGEGEGGIIGIDLAHNRGQVVADFNCGGMFRAWVNDDGSQQMAVFRHEGYEP